MRGSLEKRGNKWSFVIDIGRDPVTKKRRQKRVSGFTSEKQAKREMIKMINELNDGKYVEPTNKNLEQYLTDWLRFKEKRVAYSTFLQYESYTNNHIIPALGHLKVTDLTTAKVEEFYDSLLDNEILAEQSIHHVHRILSNAIKRGQTIGEIPRNVMEAVEPVKVPRNEMEYWDMETLNTFLRETLQDQYYIAWYLAAFTGMRQGEILGLKWRNVDLENKMIHVHRSLRKEKKEGYKISELKNTASYRSVAISDSDVFALKQHKKAQERQKMSTGEDYEDNDLVVATSIGTHVLPSNLGRSFRRALKNTGVKTIRFHDLRHTHASMLFGLKVHPKIVQERLGHSSIEVTLDRYSHMLPNMQEAVASNLEDAFKNTKEDNKNKNKDSV